MVGMGGSARISRWRVWAAVVVLGTAGAGAARAAEPVRLPAVATTQQQVVVQATGPAQVPADATAVKVTLYGAAGSAGAGSVTTADAAVSDAGPIRGGASLSVTIDQVSTTLGASLFEPWLAAPAAGAPASFPPNRQIFPNASTAPAANTGPGWAVLEFTVPAGDLADLPANADFGPLAVPGGTIRNIPLTSSGAAPLVLTSVTASVPFAVENTGTSCTPNTRIPVGGRCSIAVQVTVGQRGPVTGTLTLVGNFPGGTRTVALTAAGMTIPSAPGQLIATAGDGQNVLSWMPPSDNGGSPVTGYQVFRTDNATPGAAPALISTVSDATLLYTDTGLTQNTQYSYVVRAVNAVGMSEASAPASAMPVAGLKIVTAALLPATVGQPYAMKVAVVGGTAPYLWSMAEGETLPDGILLNTETGEFTGTPRVAGDTAMTVRVTDRALPAGQAEVQLTLTVQPAPPSASPGTAAGSGVQAARNPQPDSGSGGLGNEVWLWTLVGVAGLAGGIVAVRRLRRNRG